MEQEARPELRGRPVGVVPMMADTTCCIAASYEAKAFGVRTGTIVADAKRMCPEIVLVEAATSFTPNTITASWKPWKAACR